MNCKRGRWRPLQDAMWLLVAVATISMVITLRLGDSLTWFRSRSDTSVRDVPTDNLNHERLEHLTFQRSISNVEAGHRHHALTTDEAVATAAILDADIKLHEATEGLTGSDNTKQSESSTASALIFNKGPKNDDARAHFSSQDGGRISSSNTHDKYHSGLQQNYVSFKGSKEKGINGPSDVNPKFKSSLTVLTTASTRAQLKPREPSLIIHEESNKDSGPNSTHMSEAAGDQVTTIGPFSGEGWIQKAKASRGRTVTDLGIPGLQALYDKLSQHEKSTLPAADDSSSVVVKGSLSSVKHHLPLIESAFHKYKTFVTFEAPDNESMPPSRPLVQGDNWSIVMCLNTTFKGDDCVVMAHHSTKTKSYRKVNVIPELNDVVMSPHLLCDTGGQKQGENGPGRWCGGELPCHTHIAKDVAEDMETDCSNASGWWLVTDNNKNGAFGQYFPCQDDSSLSRSLTDSPSDNVIIPLPKNLLTLDGSAPLVWQIEVLVTSLHPPRVYLHPDGLAWEGLQEFVHRKHQKNVSLLDLRQLITDLDSESTAMLTLARLETAVLQVVRVMEHRVSAGGSTQRSCPRCFQLLEAVVVFNSTFHPVILEVTSSPNSERLSSLSDYLLEQNVLEDLAAMLVSRESTAADILWGLSALGVTQVKDLKVCEESEKFCLTQREIIYLLDTRREQRASKNWIRVFPSSVYSCQYMHFPQTNLGSTAQSKTQQPTSRFENFVVAMESYLLCPVHEAGKDESENGLNIPVHRRVSVRGDSLNDVKLLNISSASFLMTVCDNDTNSLPYLSAIYTDPYVQLFPEFSPLTTEYRAHVDYSITLVQIRGTTKHCKTQAKLEDRHESTRWSNFSLGVGENTAHILVVDTDRLDPYVLNTYKVIIHRKGADDHLGSFDPHRNSHEICSLKQDCSFPLSPEEPCGLQSVLSVSGWDDYLRHHMALPQCGPRSLSGQWVVPCSSCHDESSCYWNSAIWQPVDCSEGSLSTADLKDCLTDKKILFIGDSTNRGILHYMLERLNGSLLQWDKTHNIRIYPDLNGGETVFAFAYYPQFWLPSRERPMFDKALSELIKRTAGWADKKETVLVLGGVHWMAKHHIDMLVDGMRREGLSNAQVIVKGLGAGFHQPVSGVHQLSLADQQRMSSQNAAMLSYSSSHGFSTVDTFAMTMARYRDFLQGKCACHFHKVSAIQPPVVNKLSHHSHVPSDHHTRYHVEGNINAVYSEMVINRICANKGG